jgi:hypothetical protein
MHGEGVANLDSAIYGLLGGLCLAFGAFILLLILIPNNLTGRTCFLFCGSVVVIAGFILRHLARREAASSANPNAIIEDDALQIPIPAPKPAAITVKD